MNCTEDPWEKYFVRFDEPDCEIVPVGCVLTMDWNRIGDECGIGYYERKDEAEDRACV